MQAVEEALYKKDGPSEKIAHLIVYTRGCFSRIVQRHVLFHVLFFSILFIAFLSLAFFFSVLKETYLLGFAIALFFFALVIYFVLKIYFQQEKPEELLDLTSEYINSCREIIAFDSGVAEHHLLIANAAWTMAVSLEDLHARFYKSGSLPKFLQKMVQTISLFFHWRDIHTMQKLFLHASIKEHTDIIICTPGNVEAHAALAHAFLFLAEHYSKEALPEHMQKKKENPFQKEFIAASEAAIEEFKIAHEYAPDDPWICLQLAKCYKNLKIPEREIELYEKLLTLTPHDEEILNTLGLCYFAQGRNAQGLEIYHKLKKQNEEKAKVLIKQYGSYSFPYLEGDYANTDRNA